MAVGKQYALLLQLLVFPLVIGLSVEEQALPTTLKVIFSIFSSVLRTNNCLILGLRSWGWAELKLALA